jgi:hypothetical protein
MCMNGNVPLFELLTALTVCNCAGFTSCFDPTVPNTKAQKEKMAKTCWEHWSPETFLHFVEQQAGPGGFVHIDNEDMLPDGNCSRLTIDGNRFVNASQRPAAFDAYFRRLVNQTAAANALLPKGAPHHQVIMYTDDFFSTADGDVLRYADAIIHGVDGAQQVRSHHMDRSLIPDPPEITFLSADMKQKENTMASLVD